MEKYYSLIFAPLLFIFLLSMGISVTIRDAFYRGAVVYSFYLVLYLIMRDLLDDYVIRAKEDTESQVPEKSVALIETKEEK